MYIALITDLSGISHFHRYIPEIANAPKNAFERYELSFNPDDIAALFDQEFVQPVDEICDALIDRGVSIISTRSSAGYSPLGWKKNSSRCRLIHSTRSIPNFSSLQKAGELGAGMVIDL